MMSHVVELVTKGEPCRSCSVVQHVVQLLVVEVLMRRAGGVCLHKTFCIMILSDMIASVCVAQFPFVAAAAAFVDVVVTLPIPDAVVLDIVRGLVGSFQTSHQHLDLHQESPCDEPVDEWSRVR